MSLAAAQLIKDTRNIDAVAHTAGESWMLRFEKNDVRSRELPVCHDLRGVSTSLIEAGGLQNAPKDAALFRAVARRTGRLIAPHLRLASGVFYISDGAFPDRALSGGSPDHIYGLAVRSKRRGAQIQTSQNPVSGEFACFLVGRAVINSYT
jgi:hypothetical protein